MCRAERGEIVVGFMSTQSGGSEPWNLGLQGRAGMWLVLGGEGGRKDAHG